MPIENRELKKAGLKVTHPRVRILEVLESSRDRHLTAEEVYQELRDAGDEVGIATVYRVLTQFEQASIVEKHNFDGGQAVFELADGEHHDHMVCLETGKVIEFHSEEIERLQEEIARQHGYDISDHSLVLYVTPKK
jgi:Fur family ferric uptake transcriptional regulator